MMRDTPRTFVGTLALRLERPIGPEVIEALAETPELVPGVRISDLDVAAGTLMVTAERPTDRGDVVAALDYLGCPVCI
jgi:hypothetical protein